MLKKNRYSYTLGIVENSNPLDLYSYEYNNPSFPDQLTSFNGETISYDSLGNPLNYRGWNLSWVNGRQLEKISKNHQEVHFAYDDDGIRTDKMSDDGSYLRYKTVDGRITNQNNYFDNIEFHYDKDHNLVGFTLNHEAEYLYIKNVQNDIVGILDKDGNKVVSYEYDAWGKTTSITGSLASTLGELNPMRYRSYYLDVETGLYYLQSRYYDPEVGRFISIDEPEIIGITEWPSDQFRANLYTYSLNNPIAYLDTTGTWIIQLVSGVVAGVIFGKAAYTIASLLGVNGQIRGLITAGFALIGGVLGAFFGPKIVSKIAPKILEWAKALEKMFYNKTGLRPMLFEGQVVIGYEWQKKFKIMLHFKHKKELEKGMHISIQHYTGKNWRKTIPDIPIKTVGKAFISWVKRYIK